MKRYLIAFITILSQNLNAQEYHVFGQTFDVKNYRGCHFIISAYVKAESANPKFCQARLLAKVDTKKGIGFFDNMYKRPITSNEWKQYFIEGQVDEKAETLLIGGICFGFGKYYYDNFELKIKRKSGEWESIDVKNSGFESDDQNIWKTTHTFKGYESHFTSDNTYSGEKSLLIDGSALSPKGQFIVVNGIKFYYEAYGKGDTVLLLHGNSESIKSFKKQVPDFSKQFFVVAMDSRAQGYSSDDGNKITYELMAEDVNEFLNKLGMKNVNILGWSDGGNTGLILAMKHPDKVKKLAAMGANLFNDESSVNSKINKQIRSLRESFIKQQIPPDDIRMRMADLMLNEPKINPDDLKSINCPTLVMAGSKDAIKESHTKLIASKIKKSKLVIFEKSTHYAPQEIPERFNKTVIDFFSAKENH